MFQVLIVFGTYMYSTTRKSMNPRHARLQVRVTVIKPAQQRELAWTRVTPKVAARSRAIANARAFK